MISRIPRSIALLILLTIAMLAGPLIFGVVLGGGPQADWPPDRPIEWWTLGLVTVTFLALMVATIAAGQAEIHAPPAPPRSADPGDPPRPDKEV